MTGPQLALFIVFLAAICLGSEDGLRESTHYPADSFSDSSIKSGAAFFYFLGLFYALFAIMQIYRVYLTPCLRCAKRASCLSADTVDGVLEPITEILAECFVCSFTTFMGTTDAGISAVLGTSSYLAYIDKGVAIFIAGGFGKFDWFVGFRDLTMFSLVLFVIALALIPDYIASWNAVIMLAAFFLVIILSFFNKTIESYAKELYTSRMQAKTQMRLSQGEIAKLHTVKNSELTCSPRSLLSEDYTLSNGYLIYHHKDIERRARIRLVDGCYKEKFPKLFSCMNKIVCGYTCKILKQRIERHLNAQKRMLPDPIRAENEPREEDNSKQHGSELTPRSGQLLDERRNHADLTMRAMGPGESTMRAGPERIINSTIEEGKGIRGMMKETIDLSKLRSQQFSDSEAEKKEEDVDLKQDSITWPENRGWDAKALFILMFPMSLLLYITVPGAKVPAQGETNALALTYLISMIWIGFLAFLLSWWTVSLSIALEIRLVIIPFLIIPVGQLLRSVSRWTMLRCRISRLKKVAAAADFEDAKETSFKRDAKEQTQKTRTDTRKELIPERYTGQLFLFALWAALMWLIYALVEGEIRFETNNVWVKFIVLMATLLIKGGLMAKSGFGTPIWLALAHIGLYCVYLSLVIILEYA